MQLLRLLLLLFPLAATGFLFPLQAIAETAAPPVAKEAIGMTAPLKGCADLHPLLQRAVLVESHADQGATEQVTGLGSGLLYDDRHILTVRNPNDKLLPTHVFVPLLGKSVSVTTVYTSPEPPRLVILRLSRPLMLFALPPAPPPLPLHSSRTADQDPVPVLKEPERPLISIATAKQFVTPPLLALSYQAPRPLTFISHGFNRQDMLAAIPALYKMPARMAPDTQAYYFTTKLADTAFAGDVGGAFYTCKGELLGLSVSTEAPSKENPVTYAVNARAIALALHSAGLLVRPAE